MCEGVKSVAKPSGVIFEKGCTKRFCGTFPKVRFCGTFPKVLFIKNPMMVAQMHMSQNTLP